jgi:uncharacterized SAM-binding protein YcdF (DUF218 family)
MEEEKKKYSLFRRIAGDILLFLTVLIGSDTVIVMLGRINKVALKNNYQRALLIEIIFIVILLLFGLDVRFGIFSSHRQKISRAEMVSLKAGRIAGLAARCLITALTVLLVFSAGRVLAGSLINTSARAKHAIVLGMALENGQPSRDLLLRVETARQYAEENPEAILILTGGNPDSSGKTEADVMAELLMAQGIPEERLYWEDKARTTVENFTNSALMIDPGEPVVLITSNYHMARSVRYAQNAGFTNILRLPAPSDLMTYGASLMWEMMSTLDSLRQSIH